MAERIRDLAQSVATLDGGLRLSGLDELLQRQQILPAGRNDEHLQLLVREQRVSDASASLNNQRSDELPPVHET
jgi:hypothetical protein